MAETLVPIPAAVEAAVLVCTAEPVVPRVREEPPAVVVLRGVTTPAMVLRHQAATAEPPTPNPTAPPEEAGELATAVVGEVALKQIMDRAP
jgi:hypothetical protein